MAAISTKCTSCGADLTLDDSREFAFCQYCGNKMLMSEIKKTIHTTIIHDEAEILRAQTEAKEADLKAKQAEINEKRIRKKEKAKRIKLIFKIILSIAIIVGGYILVSNWFKPKVKTDPYKLIESSAFTGKAFSITKEEVISTFLKNDTQSVSNYYLEHTKWYQYEKKEQEDYIAEKFKKVYNGEKIYYCSFYKPSDDSSPEEPKGTKYYEAFVITDKDEHVILWTLKVLFKDGTVVSNKELNGYFGITLPGIMFSAVSGLDANYVNGKFKDAQGNLFTDYEVDENVKYTVSKSDNLQSFTLSVNYK